MTLKVTKHGAHDKTFSASDRGYRINAYVTEHGYKLRMSVEIDYSALTERETEKTRGLLYAALVEALNTGKELRRDNAPLFPLEELTPQQSRHRGVNTQ